jgi:peroxiredoxin Q/BCP
MTHAIVGKPIPEFTASSTQGEVSAHSLRGHNTPGCTTQAQGFRDRYQDFVNAGCQIVGVSRDSLKSHAGFTEKQSLPFPLISDEGEALCQAFDVIKMKNMYGKQVRGIERSTFLIDRHGVLLREWRGLRVPGHVDDVLEAVRAAAAN